MVKRILASSLAAILLAGCGGGGGNSGSAYIKGVNAIPNLGSVSITANGSVILNNSGYLSASSSFVGAGSGTSATIFLTNSSNTQLASGTTTLSNGDYYTAFAIGNAINQYVFIYPTDVSAPAVNTAKVSFVNCSVLQPSVDVYIAPQGATTLGTAAISSMTPFNSGQEVTSLTAGTTYTVQFNVAGTNVSLGETTVTTGTTPATNEIQLIAITDSPTGTTPGQTILPAIAVPVVVGASSPKKIASPMVIGHPNMTLFPPNVRTATRR
jgi:hypothetical protein